jgi:hypothetical protein
LKNNKATDSSLWKALENLYPAIENASVWSIGSGRSIDEWSEAWIEDGFILEQIVEIPQHLRGWKLFELVDMEAF